jgi:hypothetical protein
MFVQIDESGRDNEASSIDNFLPLQRLLSDFDDLAGTNANVPGPSPVRRKSPDQGNRDPR